MSQLPNAQRAVVPLEKFTEYSLNPGHPLGRHKARVFSSALGLTLEDAAWLRDRVYEAALTQDAVPEYSSPYGNRYVIDFTVTTDQGSAVVRSTWMIREDEDFPRLTSCYVK